MGGSANLTSLSFDILYEPVETAPLHERIAVNAVNWVYTNRQGMTFGLLLAATLMTLLAQFNAAAVKNRFANSAIGLFVGSSLGVCVNCAAPIAQGMSKSGARQETALSTMLSSPTLNFIVLSMVFALFPLYLALLKIALTIVVILIVVPLVVRLFPSASIAEEFDNAQVCSLEDSPMAPMLPLYSDTTWLASLQWVAITFARNLWYIVKIAVPLMLLAGFLGAALITLIPFEKLIDYLPIDNRLQIVASMIALACLCIFLPVPMAFDVVISAVLLAAGMPVMYVAVILFTLGIYSVYGYFIAAQLSSWKTASALFVVLVGIGVLAGISAKVLGDRATIKQNELLVSTLSDLSTDKTPGLIEFIPDDLVMNTSTVRSKADVSLVATQLPLPTTRIHSDNSLTVASIPFEAKSTGQSTNLFDLVDNTQIGVNPPFSFEISQALIMRFRSISSGDINNDHWSDVAVSDSQGLYVYLNQSGQHFVRKELSLPLFEGEYVTNAVLVDINNDTQLDLFVATYNIGNYIVFNRNGEFLDENTVRLPNHPEALRTVSSVFGDIDRDGDLDIVLGNWSMGVVANKLSLPSSKNVWLKQTPAGFTLESLSGKPGETLSTLLSDINGDGILDLMVGNDFDVRLRSRVMMQSVVIKYPLTGNT